MADYHGSGAFDLVWDEGYENIFTYGGNDIIFEVQGQSAVDGGTGTDWLSFYYALEGVWVDYSYSSSAEHDGEVFHYDGTGYLHETDRFVDFESIEIISGSNFKDVLLGSRDDDRLYGWEGGDFLNGHQGADDLYGGGGEDRIWLGGSGGGDEAWGGADSDTFCFSLEIPGDVFFGGAAVIHDFAASFTSNERDEILIYLGDYFGDRYVEDLEYAGRTPAPGEREYSVWERNGEFVVTWQFEGTFHDVRVQGDDPTDHIVFTNDITYYIPESW